MLDGNEITTAGTAVNYVTEDGKVILAGGQQVILSDGGIGAAAAGFGEGDEIVIAAADDEEVGKVESHAEQSSYIIQGQDDYKVGN